MTAIIAILSANRVIAQAGRLPWRIPADQQWFRQHTMGHPVIMGRPTYEEMGRPLVGRTTIVLSRRPTYAPPGVLVAHTLDEALALASEAPGSDEVFIAGGGQVYEQALAAGVAERMYLTVVDQWLDEAQAVLFPAWCPDEWLLVTTDCWHQWQRLRFAFKVYDRRG